MEGLFFMFLHCQLERPGYKGTIRNTTDYPSHLIKPVWMVKYENKTILGVRGTD